MTDDHGARPAWYHPPPVYYHDPMHPEDPSRAATAVAEPAPAQAPEVTSVPAPEVAPAPARSTSGAPRPRPRRRVRRRVAGATMLVLTLAALAVGASRVFGWFSVTHAFSTPRGFDNLQLQSLSVVPSERALVSQGWTQVRGGAYGSSGVTQAMLLLGRPPASLAESDAMAQVLPGQLVADALVFNPRTASLAERSGTEFTCGPASSAARVVSLCAWTDGDVAGILVDYSGQAVDRTLAQTILARAAAEH